MHRLVGGADEQTLAVDMSRLTNWIGVLDDGEDQVIAALPGLLRRRPLAAVGDYPFDARIGDLLLGRPGQRLG